MPLSLLSLVLGLACAGVGGELLLRAVRGLAHAWRLSAAFAGASIAAFTTSSPELAVAIGAALAGSPEVAFGDCLGGNVVNVAFILGAALILGPLQCSRESTRRDLPMAIVAPLLTALVSLDGVITRWDGVGMLAAFFAWAAVGWRTARQAAAEMASDSRPALWRILSGGIAGLLLLVAASKLIVSGALGVATALGWTPFVIGAVIVAIGTSTPEIVTTMLARFRGEDDIGLGTILGSNVFNLLFIVALAATLHPIRVTGVGPWIGLAVGLGAVGVALPRRNGVIARAQGAALLGCYLVYVGASIWFESLVRD